MKCLSMTTLTNWVKQIRFFDDKVSFVINDEEFGNRLALFAAGGKTVVAPYILRICALICKASPSMDCAQPTSIHGERQPFSARVQEDVINSYVTRQWIESGQYRNHVQEQNFVASGEIEVPTPKALWRVVNRNDRNDQEGKT